jgi:alkylated DNA repair dioxygenase AlkB
LKDPCTLAYTKRFVEDHIALFERLAAELPLKQHDLVICGRQVPQPRLVAWFGPGPYTYSGLTLEPQEWLDDLLLIRRQLRKLTKIEFNSVLCNYYRDENDSVDWHSDDERYFGHDPIIATISLGAPRLFCMKRKVGGGKPDKQILESGSLFIMGAGVQKHWLHAVPKSRVPVGPRLSLTYRVYYDRKTGVG